MPVTREGQLCQKSQRNWCDRGRKAAFVSEKTQGPGNLYLQQLPAVIGMGPVCSRQLYSTKGDFVDSAGGQKGGGWQGLERLFLVLCTCVWGQDKDEASWG